jgi:hypothetical protein
MVRVIGASNGTEEIGDAGQACFCPTSGYSAKGIVISLSS